MLFVLLLERLAQLLLFLDKVFLLRRRKVPPPKRRRNNVGVLLLDRPLAGTFDGVCRCRLVDLVAIVCC